MDGGIKIRLSSNITREELLTYNYHELSKHLHEYRYNNDGYLLMILKQNINHKILTDEEQHDYMFDHRPRIHHLDVWRNIEKTKIFESLDREKLEYEVNNFWAKGDNIIYQKFNSFERNGQIIYQISLRYKDTELDDNSARYNDIEDILDMYNFLKERENKLNTQKNEEPELLIQTSKPWWKFW